MGKFYITIPIYYPNADLHIGHAYTTTLADIAARYHRMEGDDTYFLVGADENAEKVIQSAKETGEDPKEFLDKIIERFKEFFKTLNISNDQFIRTTDKEKHWPGAQALWKKLDESGDIYKKEYEGLYCVGCEAFITEKDLVDGKCPDHDMKPTYLKEENYFFRLSKYSEKLKEKIESDELEIIPESRKNEVLAFINQGLEDVSFSRPKEKIFFGVPVPGDDEHVMYVWGDALVNYISALGYGREDDELFRKFWPADYHIMGKDILKFHALYWPAMLLSAGIQLPKRIFVHGMILSGGRKMSKTLGNIIDPFELINEYGIDAVRYYLARKISPFQDGDMTKEAFHEIYNGELANGLGNLVARVMKMAETNLKTPVTIADLIPDEVVKGKYMHHMENFEFNKAMDVVWERIQELDQYIQKEQPFKKIKENREEAINDIVFLVSGLQGIAHMITPVMPETAEKIKRTIQDNKMPETLFERK